MPLSRGAYMARFLTQLDDPTGGILRQGFESEPMSERNSTEWWNAPGPDYCEFCRHGFHVEIGYYCAECDRPICALCIVTVRGQQAILCPECSAEGDA